MMKFAGILPFARDAEGSLFVLLGREAFGADKGLWSGFAGRYDSPDESPLDVASREGFEESMGLLGTPAYLKRQLKRRSTTPVPVHLGMHYLLPIAFDAALPFRYDGIRGMYKNVGVNFKSYSKNIEKDRVRWMPFLRKDFARVVPLRTGFVKDIAKLQSILRTK